MTDRRRALHRATLGVTVLLAACSSTTVSSPAAPTSTEPVTAPPAPTTAPTSASTQPPSSVEASAPEPTPDTTTPVDPPPGTAALDGLELAFEPVIDVYSPTAVAWTAGDTAMYVTTQEGEVLRVDGDDVSTVIDLRSETATLEPGSERGLLGIAFDPRDGRMFLDMTDRDNDTVIVSYELVDGVAVAESRREVLAIDQPGLGHNGGRLVFDADGNLLIASGDGGGSNGRDAQDTTKLLGVLLRIRPDLDGDGYSIPDDNPFADGVADRPEVYARGFRNPWGFSLDDETGDIWIGDVGNDQFEEIDVIRRGESGQNFGWSWFEGDHQRRADAPDGLTPPVFSYPRAEGIAVMGGHVYRGQAIPALRGAYVFGDLGGSMWAIGADGVATLDVEPIAGLVGWGEDPSGELYVLGLYDGIFRVVPG